MVGNDHVSGGRIEVRDIARVLCHWRMHGPAQAGADSETIATLHMRTAGPISGVFVGTVHFAADRAIRDFRLAVLLTQ